MHMAPSIYSLPTLVGEQYVLTSVLRETRDTIIYEATQKDMRREVIVESLRPEAMQDQASVRFFLESARAQARLNALSLSSPLELLYADGTWHLAKERIQGESLDSVLSSGNRLDSASICNLMLKLCHLCICMDIEGIDSSPFSLLGAYAVGSDFRFDNPARAGRRERTASRHFLTEAARQAERLLRSSSIRAEDVRTILKRMYTGSNWNTLTPLACDEELTRLHLLILQESASQ